MKILFNFSPLKKGGGQNVGLNFIYALNKLNIEKYSHYFLIASKSEIHKQLKRFGYTNIISFSQNPLVRIIQEIILLPLIIKKNKIDIVYTYFGFAFLSRKITQVCGVAVSNIFYPEINFWDDYIGIKLIMKKITNRYWIWGIKRAHGLIFENESMRNRSFDIFGIPMSKSIFIRPSNNMIEMQKNYKGSFCYCSSTTLKLLLLCGWQRNKNILKVPEIAFELKRYDINFEFIITAPIDNSPEHIEFLKLTKIMHVEDCIKLIGPVKKDDIPDLYNSIDYVLLMSKLESFSNNIIEAWVFQKPLLITDSDWARAICNDAAIYISRESSAKIAAEIIDIKNSPDKIRMILNNYKHELKKYPTIVDKAIQEIKFIEKIYETSAIY